MDDPAAQLKEALHQRLALIADESSRRNAQVHMERLREVSERIHEFTAQLPAPVDPRLKHYLDRCSYDKALEFLEGRAESRP